MYSVETINGKHKTVNIVPKDGSIIIDNSKYNTIEIAAVGDGNLGVYSVNKCIDDIQLIAGNNINITADTTNNTIEIESVGGGSVDSVNGKVGDVVIGISDINNLQDEIDDAKFDGHLNNDLFVSGSSFLQGPELHVDGETNFNHNVNMNTETVIKDLSVNGNSILRGSLYVQNDSIVNAGLQVQES
jgi:hypothetical protein